MIWRSKPLFPLPDGQSWWVLQSIIESSEGVRWRIFHLSWGRDEDEASANYLEDAAKLDETLMQAAIQRGDISDADDWERPSKLVKHERVVQVRTMRDVKRMDRGLADMLREHEGFEIEFMRDGPSVIGGGFYEVR